MSISVDIPFSTDKSQVDFEGRALVESFVDAYYDVFAGGDYDLDLRGSSSRIGDDAYNQWLSEQRTVSVKEAVQEALGDFPLDEDRVNLESVGEQDAAAEGASEQDDSAEYRIVKMTLVGSTTRRISK